MLKNLARTRRRAIGFTQAMPYLVAIRTRLRETLWYDFTKLSDLLKFKLFTTSVWYNVAVAYECFC